MSSTDISIQQSDGYWIGRFSAMASPCELLMEVKHRKQAVELTNLAYHEAKRVEQKFSRYRKDNIIYRINHSHGQAIEADQELAGLFDYAQQCYELSDGKFDITSGVLREAWTFDCSDHVPDKRSVDALLQRVGWNKITWNKPYITLPEGMQIDLGGIGKEYAVDRTALLLQQQTKNSLLVNFGGDMFVNKPRHQGQGWFVGVENPEQGEFYRKSPTHQLAAQQYEVSSGGIATSGDAKRYLMKNGVRYGHILDPATGWPVAGAPKSVTVAAGTCTEAGILATLAMLKGEDAEVFLQQQEVTYWCIR